MSVKKNEIWPPFHAHGASTNVFLHAKFLYLAPVRTSALCSLV